MTLAERMIVMNAGRMRADRHARRGVSPPGEHLRRRLHRLAGDEPGRGAPEAGFTTPAAIAPLPRPAPRAGELVSASGPSTSSSAATLGGGLAAARPGVEMLGAERLVYWRARRDALHRASRRDADAAEGRRHRRHQRVAGAPALVRRRERHAVGELSLRALHDGLAVSAAGRASRRRQAPPENTLAAFRVGAAHGYRAFECDVKLSADACPSCFTTRRWSAPPAAAARRPGSPGASWRGSTPALARRAFAGEPLPTLASDRALLPAQCLRPATSRSSRRRAAEARDRRVVASTRRRCGATRAMPPLLSSFQRGARRRARRGARVAARPAARFARRWLDARSRSAASRS